MCGNVFFFFPALPSNVKALSNSQGSTLALLGTDSTANQRSKVLLKTKTTTRATVLASYHHKHTLATAPAGPSRSLRSFKMAKGVNEERGGRAWDREQNRDVQLLYFLTAQRDMASEGAFRENA